ncbi:hypothetical protein [Parapedobacter tibetensis]|uniref:hypothetical protein n=1 Tax=Parapedobacter tibetensis TaxID=2972951 RepID=UPI00214DD6E7|nr:hypothetical protein [Parapedobacter tibetensis]
MIPNRTSIIAAIAAITLFGSCRNLGEPYGRDKLYNNATNIDFEGFTFFKTVHEKAVFETHLAKHVQSAPASPAAKEVAAKVIETYEEVIPELENLAVESLVILPDPGMPVFTVPHHFAADSLGSFDSEGYIAHVQHEQQIILEQLSRVDHNTVKSLNRYAKEKLPLVNELYALTGGKEDHGAHH